MSSNVRPEEIHIYGGITESMWTLLNYRPQTWDEGREVARLCAAGGLNKIPGLFPAGVVLRQETVPALSRDKPVVSREEKFASVESDVGSPAAGPADSLPAAPIPAPLVAPPLPAAQQPSAAGKPQRAGETLWGDW